MHLRLLKVHIYALYLSSARLCSLLQSLGPISNRKVNDDETSRNTQGTGRACGPSRHQYSLSDPGRHAGSYLHRTRPPKSKDSPRRMGEVSCAVHSKGCVFIEGSGTMSSATPMMASETTAARLLDLKTPHFLKLVDDGHLPPGQEIAPTPTSCRTAGWRRSSGTSRAGICRQTGCCQA